MPDQEKALLYDAASGREDLLNQWVTDLAKLERTSLTPSSDTAYIRAQDVEDVLTKIEKGRKTLSEMVDSDLDSIQSLRQGGKLLEGIIRFCGHAWVFVDLGPEPDVHTIANDYMVTMDDSHPDGKRAAVEQTHGAVNFLWWL